MNVPPPQRDKWRKWAKDEVGGDDPTIDAAADAALTAHGHPIDDPLANLTVTNSAD